MSFIRDHLHTFVYPGIQKYGITDPQEYLTLLQTSYLKKERVNSFYVKNVGQSWIDRINSNRGQKTYNLVQDALNAIENKIKPWQKLILPGRDCWLFHVAAMKRKALRNRSVFIPCLSRNVAGSRVGLQNVIKDYNILPEDFIFDTGFSGTVLAAMQKALGSEASTKFAIALQEAQVFSYCVDFPNARADHKRINFACWGSFEVYPQYQMTQLAERCGVTFEELRSIFHAKNMARDAFNEPLACANRVKAVMDTTKRTAYLLSSDSQYYICVLQRNSYRDPAVTIERMPKYWHTGKVDSYTGKVKQEQTSQEEFSACALMTLDVAGKRL